jgi:hypothetical protein
LQPPDVLIGLQANRAQKSKLHNECYKSTNAPESITVESVDRRTYAPRSTNPKAKIPSPDYRQCKAQSGRLQEVGGAGVCSRGEMRTRGGAAKPSCHDAIGVGPICLLRLRRWCRAVPPPLDVGPASAGSAAGKGVGIAGLGDGRWGRAREVSARSRRVLAPRRPGNRGMALLYFPLFSAHTFVCEIGPGLFVPEGPALAQLPHKTDIQPIACVCARARTRPYGPRATWALLRAP